MNPLAALRKLADEMRKLAMSADSGYATDAGVLDEMADTLDSALRLLEEGKVEWVSCGDCDPCIGGRPDQCAVGRFPMLREPTPAPDEAGVRAACSELVSEFVKLDAAADEDNGDAEEDAYNVGKRDGFHDAVQLFDLATGGDGEFVGSSEPGGTVDVPVMIRRIVARLTPGYRAALLGETK